MRLMVSVVSAAEASQALTAGVDLLDIKNPAEGSLGAQSPGVLSEIKKLTSGNIEISAAIGDMPNLPGTAALAALGAATCGVDYIKVGLYGPRSESEAKLLLHEVRDAVRGFNLSIIAACYADYKRVGSLNPEYLPNLAASTKIKGCMVDTAVKDGHTLFDFMTPDALHSLVEQAHAAGLLFGVAGALREQDLPLLRDIGADVAGLRTAVCRDNNRSGPLDPFRVRTLIEKFGERGAIFTRRRGDVTENLYIDCSLSPRDGSFNSGADSVQIRGQARIQISNSYIQATRSNTADLAGDLSDAGLLAGTLDDSPARGTIWDVHVELSSTAEKQLAKMPEYIVKKFALWVDLVSVDGLATARAIPGYRDHILKGEWKGYRAIRLSNAYRAIYQERQAGTIQLVYVEEVNKHDY